MKKFSLFVGLDVSKKTFNAAFRISEKLLAEKLYDNDAKGISSFLQDLWRYKVEKAEVLVALEHCGVYREKITMALAAEDIFTWLWNPLIAKHATLEVTRHKDDLRDACAMAELAETHHKKAIRYVPDNEEQREIKDLFLLRKQLVKERAQVYNQRTANRDKAIPNHIAERIHQDRIGSLTAQIKEVEKATKKLIFANKNLKTIYQILISIPGIGPVTATQLIEVTHGFTKFQSEKQLSKFIGIMPLKHQSGTSLKRKPKVSKRASKPLKVNLTMGIMSVTRPGLFFHDFYTYKTQIDKKEHLQVINIIRNTLLKLAFKLVQAGQKFDPDLFISNKKSWRKHLTLS